VAAVYGTTTSLLFTVNYTGSLNTVLGKVRVKSIVIGCEFVVS